MVFMCRSLALHHKCDQATLGTKQRNEQEGRKQGIACLLQEMEKGGRA